MQTIDRPTLTPRGDKGPPSWLPFVVAPLAILIGVVLVASIMNKWAVLILTILAALVGLGVWTWQRGFRAIEIVAFLIHFDGLEFSVISVGRISAAVLTIVILRKLIVEKWRPPAVQFKNWFPIWLLFTWMMVTGLWSSRAGGWFKAFLMLYLAFVFFSVTSMLVENHKDIQRFLRAFWVGGLFGSATGILALFLGTRSVGLIGDPNFFGLVEAAMIPLTVYYLRHATNRRERWFYFVTLAVVLGGAAGAGSRSGLIGASIAIVATLVLRPGISMRKRAKMSAVALLITPLAFAIGFVANPANLQRGFADRGAGRLDFWNVTTELIKERPILGQGFGQLQYEIPQRLFVTQGVKMLDEKRTTVSSHNTWLDILGDSGVVGVGLFMLCFVMAGWSLLKPRWPYLSDLSTTVFIMLLPVLSSSLFLPLANNKLAWSIIGLAAAFQVPSVSSRWSGLTGDERPIEEASLVPVSSRSIRAASKMTDRASTALVPYEHPVGALVHVREQAIRANPLALEAMPAVRLARWDLRITRAMLRNTVVVTVLCAAAIFVVTSAVPATFSATTGFVAPDLNLASSVDIFRLPTDRSQQALALVASPAYAQSLKSLSGIDRSIEQITDHVTVEKPAMGGLVTVTFRDRDRAVVEQAAPYLFGAVTQMYASAQEFGAAGVNQQSRPINPGEQNYLAGPPVINVFGQPAIEGAKPKRTWMTLMGSLAAATFTLGLYMSGCRRPRVALDDDFESHTSTKVWLHLSRGRREPLASATAQIQQLANVALEASGTGPLRRLLIAPCERSTDVRRLVIDLAATFASVGERVVIVDGDVSRPWLFRRLNPRAKGAGSDERLNLLSVSRRGLTSVARNVLRGGTEDLRVVSGTELVDPSNGQLDPSALEHLDPSITVIVLAPPPDGGAGLADMTKWSQVTLIPMRRGLTTTEAAQRGTARVRLLSRGRSGIVMLDN